VESGKKGVELDFSLYKYYDIILKVLPGLRKLSLHSILFTVCGGIRSCDTFEFADAETLVLPQRPVEAIEVCWLLLLAQFRR